MVFYQSRGVQEDRLKEAGEDGEGDVSSRTSRRRLKHKARSAKADGLFHFMLACPGAGCQTKG